jgi:hypothetical protein
MNTDISELEPRHEIDSITQRSVKVSRGFRFLSAYPWQSVKSVVNLIAGVRDPAVDFEE